MSGADRLCLLSLQYNEHLPVSSCLSSNPFVVRLPFSFFCLPLCSCHSSLPLHLSLSLSRATSSPGLTVLPLLNERFANRSLTLFVLPPLQCTALNILFVLPAAKLHYTFFFLFVCIAPSPPVCFLLGAQPGEWTATDEAPCLSAMLEGINHNSVSALMRIQRCLL